MANFFTSDTHFGHGNIIKYCNRVQFMSSYEKEVMTREDEEEIKRLKISDESLRKMDKTLIERWNIRVKKTDTVYFLGDFCFKKSTEAPNANPFEYYRNQLNGNIIFIMGNHDNRNGFKTILEASTIKIGGERIYLVHKPEHMNMKYSLGFCGHVHNAWKFKKVASTVFVNVGTDVWNFYPTDINQITKALTKWRKSNDFREVDSQIKRPN